MILDSDRSHAVDLNNEAVLAGAAKFKACDELDINVRTFQHWVVDGAIKTDGRPKAIHPEPKNKLSSADLVIIVNRYKMKNKICLVTEELAGFQGSGGIGAAFSELAELLAKKGYQVDVLYCAVNTVDDKQKKYMLNYLSDLGIKLNLLNVEKYCWDVGYEHKSYAVYQELKKKNYDIVHFHDFKGLGFASVSAKHQGIEFENTQFVVQMHGPTCWTINTNNTMFIHEDQLKIDFMEKEMVRKADYVVSPSAYLIEYLINEEGFKFPEGRTQVIKNLCSVLFDQLKRYIDENRSTYLEKIDEIVLFARHEDRKGFVQFCDAIELLKDKLENENVQLTFLGKMGSIAGQSSGIYITKRAKNWNFPIKMITHYHRKEAAQYLTSNPNSLVVIPSEENSPYTVFEALTLKKALITSKHGGAKELIDPSYHKETICDAFNGIDIASLIDQWITKGGKIPKPSQGLAEIEENWLKFHELTLIAPKDNRQSLRNPKVTFGITHFERAEKLIDAIVSILKQSYKNIEIIVVDDGSQSDKTKKALKRIEALLERVGGRLIYQENAYLGAARNTIASNSQSEYLCFLDDDDLAKSELIDKLVTAAETSNADIVNCLNQFMDISRRSEGIANTDNFKEKISYVPLGGPLSVSITQNCLGAATALIRRSFFEKIGGYTEMKGVGYEDYEFFLKASQAGGKIEILPEPLYLYEVGLPSMISNTSVMKNFKRVFDAISIENNSIEYKKALNLQIGKHAQTHQENSLHWAFKHNEHSDLILPILTGEFTGTLLLNKLSEYATRLGSNNIAEAFHNSALDKEVFDSGVLDRNVKKQTMHFKHKRKKETLDLNLLSTFDGDIKFDLALQRYSDAMNKLIKYISKQQVMDENIAAMLRMLTAINERCLYDTKQCQSLINTLENIECESELYNEVTESVALIVLNSNENSFIKEYISEIISMDDTEYLDSYPDVAEAVKKKAVDSGLAHYSKAGKKEGRNGFNGANILLESYIRKFRKKITFNQLVDF